MVFYLKRFCVFMLISVMFWSCKNQNKKHVDFVYADWTEGIAMVHVAQRILEDQGYDVSLQKADVALVFSTLAKGDADVFLEAWLPDFHKNFMDEYSDDLEELDTIYKGGKAGLVVPQYVGIDSISELNEFKDKFNREIIGIEAGAVAMNTTRKMIDSLGLDFELNTSSESGMLATLRKRTNEKKWVVVYGWKPHWMFNRYDLKFLKGNSEIYGSTQYIIAFSRLGFKDNNPYVARFVKNMKLDDETMGDLMETFDKTDDEEKAAKKWVKEHPDIVSEWLPNEDDK